MWTTNGQYSDPGMDYYEKKYNEQVLKNLRKKKLILLVLNLYQLSKITKTPHPLKPLLHNPYTKSLLKVNEMFLT